MQEDLEEEEEESWVDSKEFFCMQMRHGTDGDWLDSQTSLFDVRKRRQRHFAIWEPNKILLEHFWN